MDVNKTKYHLISGDEDWLQYLSHKSARRLLWDRKRKTVSLVPRILSTPHLPKTGLLTMEDRRGAAFDQYGNVYWIGPDKDNIMIQPVAGPPAAGVFWSTADLFKTCDPSPVHGIFVPEDSKEPAWFPTLCGLAVTAHQYLIAGSHDPAGLLIFDLHGGGVPVRLNWPDTVPFFPIDIAAGPDGGIWILDRDLPGGNNRLWRLNRFFQVIPAGNALMELGSPGMDLYDPLSGLPRKSCNTCFPAGILMDYASPVDMVDPISIACLPNGGVMILETGPGESESVIHYLSMGISISGNNKTRPKGAKVQDTVFIHQISLDSSVIGGLLDTERIRAHDFAFKSAPAGEDGRVEGSLFIAGENGGQTFEFLFEAGEKTLTLALQPPFLPMRGYSGKGLISAFDDIYYDFGDRWIPLAEQPRRRYYTYREDESDINPFVEGIVFDGEAPDCVWHRLMVDGCFPKGTQVSVESRTANSQSLLKDMPWRQEPKLYLRGDGSELPFHLPFSDEELANQGTGTWEALLQNAKGRWIELRFSFFGTGRATPRIRNVRVYYPRFSYLEKYLPAVYQEDAMSAHFLDRFLANTEGIFTAMEGRIERAEALFDTRTTPDDFLEWLAGWMGGIIDPSWSGERKRLFIDHARLLYHWRGTLIGLRAAIRLSIDAQPDHHIFNELRHPGELCFTPENQTGVRIIEQFITRGHGGIRTSDPRMPTILNLAAEDAPWDPSQGADLLHQRFRSFLDRLYRQEDGEKTFVQRINDAWGSHYATPEEIRFLPLRPEHEQAAADWNRFIRTALGFDYSAVTENDTTAFQEFLARRYLRIEDLNKSYGRVDYQPYSAFTDIQLPSELPAAAPPLSDWIEFVSLALPIRHNAHRFRVLVPTYLGELSQSRDRKKARVEEIVRREKPAHTDFEVQLYWAMFRIGTARLGLDTTIGEGGRFTALVLGANYLNQSFLAASHPWCVRDRTIIGRDRLNA